MQALADARYAANLGLAPTTAREVEDQSMAKWSAISNALATIRSVEAYKNDPYNSVQGLPTIGVDLENMTIQEVMSFQKALNAGPLGKKTSAAVGAYQFTPSTLALALSKTNLSTSSKFSKAAQDQLAMAMLDHRAAQATKNGIVDAKSFANALSMEWAGLASSTGKSHYDGVQGNKAGVGFNTTLSIARGLVDAGAVGPQSGKTSVRSGPAPATSTVNGYAVTPTTNAPTPYGRTDTNASPTQQAYEQAARTMEISGVRGLDGRVGPQDPSEVGGVIGAPSSLPAYAPNGRTPPSPTAAPTQAPSVVPAQQAPTSTPRSFASTYLDPQQPAAPPAEPATPSRNSSLGRTLASTAIDVGVGAVPGLGVAASAVNLGLQIAGRPSIGQMAVDAFSSAPGWQDAPQTAARDGGDVAELPLPANMTETERAVVQERVQDFASTYLGFRDDTQRPTPREKWGDRSRYAAREYAA